MTYHKENKLPLSRQIRFQTKQAHLVHASESLRVYF